MANQPMKKTGDKKTITLRVPVELAKKLEEEAGRLGVSVNALILMRIQQ